MMIYNLQREFWSMYGRFIWDKHQPSWKQEQIEHVVNRIKRRSHGIRARVLDAGCGTGEYTVALAQAGFDAVGVDYASGMLYCAEKKITPATQHRLTFQKGSYWTVVEVGTMIRDAGFEIINVEAEPVIFIEARKLH